MASSGQERPARRQPLRTRTEWPAYLSRRSVPELGLELESPQDWCSSPPYFFIIGSPWEL